MSAAGLALLFGCAFCLPAPEHLTMQSVNFRHTLSWNPGAGTPPGTSYVIYDASSRQRRQIKASNRTRTSLKLEAKFHYQLTVVASHNSRQSPESQKLQFAPYTDTKIDPPQVLLSGCGACLQVSVALPGGRNGTGVDVHDFYKPYYSVLIRKRAEQEANGSPYKTTSRNFTLEHLRSGTEYCIQVHVLITLNQNTRPSAWTCAFTSTAKPYTGPLIAGLVAGLGLILVGAVMASAFCLTYMGFICKLQMALPPVLLGLRRGYTLNPERTVPDQISISPRVEGHKPNGPAALQPAEEEEEEEEGGGNNYMVGNFELSDESPCSKSAVGLPAAPHADQPEGEEEEEEEEEVGHAEGQEDMAEGEEGSEEEEKKELEEVEEEEQQQVFLSSGDIDLLSVTLGALVTCEEEEQTVEWTEQQALLSHDRTAMSVRTPVEDQRLPHEEEEEEEEEESSAYLRH